MDVARKLVKIVRGPLATVYACPFCQHREIMPKGIPGVGRGYGLRHGGAMSSRVAAHIRKDHPGKLEAEKTG